MAVSNVEAVRKSVMAVAVDKCSKSSRVALKWAIDHVVSEGQSLMLIHVDVTTSPALPLYGDNELEIRKEPNEKTMDVLRPYICFCKMRQVECEPVVLQHSDISSALKEFISFYTIETFVIGVVERHWTTRIFRGADVPTKLENNIPASCVMYRILNGRIQNTNSTPRPFRHRIRRVVAEETISPELVVEETTSVQESPPVSVPVSAPISRISSTTQPDEFSFHEGISVINSDRPSTDSTFISFYKILGNKRLSADYTNKNMFKFCDDHSRNVSVSSCQPDDPVSLNAAA